MSHLLILRKILTGPQNIDFERESITFGNGDNPAILIYGNKLSSAVLKSPDIVPANLVQYCYDILKLPPGLLPNIENLFSHSPIFLSGEKHLDFRKIFSKKYREIEKNLIYWAPKLTAEFIKSKFAKSKIDPIKASQAYVDSIFRHIAARDLGIEEASIPPFPERLMTLYPNKEKLTRIENRLEALRYFYEKRLMQLGRDPIDAQILLTINVVGGEPLEAALCVGLFQPPPNQTHWNPKELFHVAAPVNFFGRVVKRDVVIDDASFKQGQEIFICPNIIHSYISHNNGDSSTSYSFGKGLHTCLGQGISMKVGEYFLSEIDRQKIAFPKIDSNIKFIRDNINLRARIAEVDDGR